VARSGQGCIALSLGWGCLTGWTDPCCDRQHTQDSSSDTRPQNKISKGNPVESILCPNWAQLRLTLDLGSYQFIVLPLGSAADLMAIIGIRLDLDQSGVSYRLLGIVHILTIEGDHP
jgi:hypothetical protein